MPYVSNLQCSLSLLSTSTVRFSQFNLHMIILLFEQNFIMVPHFVITKVRGRKMSKLLVPFLV
jgi:hypothetical protein